MTLLAAPVRMTNEDILLKIHSSVPHLHSIRKLFEIFEVSPLPAQIYIHKATPHHEVARSPD